VNGVVRVLASPAIAAGFRLAGLPAYEARGSGDASTQLQQLAEKPDTCVLLVEQSLLDGIAEPVRALLDRRSLPIIVPVPTVVWGEERRGAADYILDLLQRAIGYRVKLR
jgi:vacuolar-type H+-ATPase subunit F/Vma7